MLTTSLLFTMTACQSKDPEEEQSAFQEFMNTAFQTEMKENYAKAYTYMEQPATYGINEDEINTTLSANLSNEQRNVKKDYINTQQKELKSFSYDLLTDEQKAMYDTYSYMLDVEEDLLSDTYRYIYHYFSTLDGVHLQLVSQLQQVNVSSKTQAEMMISYILSIPSYIGEILAYTKTQQEKGTLLVDAETVKTQCNEIIEEQESSSFYTTLQKKITDLSIEDDEKEELQTQLKEVFLESFIPAYKSIVSLMDSISSSENVSSLSDIKKGTSYYEDLFKQLTGSERSVEDSLKLLEEKLQTAQKSELVVANKNTELYEDWLDNKYRTELTSYEDIMQDLYDANSTKFPTVDLYDYEIEEVEETTNGVSATAQSLPFALDTTKTPIITINTNNSENQVDSLQAFVSLAQAGIPGSYYMRLYQYQTISSNWMKVCAENQGYINGFQAYSALYALKSLSNVHKGVLQLQQKQVQYYNYALAIADIRVHYEGASEDEIVTFLKSVGWSEKDAQSTYQTIVYNPGYFVSAGVGLIEILELYTDAQDTLGTSLNDIDFHETILKYGNVPFSVLQEQVNTYIENNK